ncbi:MAG TPA: Gfo/Idh/MocA family oxidoreductase [Chloroflexota bacterium]|nr:Gfo/Idh/MocA family oxidoreductase [Chloroflexota bacterium]
MNGKDPVRVAVIGVGANVFKMHAPALHRPDVEVVAVVDVNVAAAERQAEDFGCPFFADHRAMLAATSPQAAVVLAPHPFHAPLAIDCLTAGAHVLVEKPMAVEVAEADAMIDAARQANRLLAVNLQHRTRAEIRTARRLIDEGRLGQIQRVEMVAIWTRTASYYAMARWRGTWLGEGGGVLMNQSPHSLDLVCHLAGQPSRVVAWNRTIYHAIEAEDTSLAMLEWPTAVLGTLLVSTAQSGDAERLEIGGTRGTLRLAHGNLQLFEADQDLRDFLRENREPFGEPQLTERDVPLDPGDGNHQAIYDNFITAIHGGGPLVADGAEGRLSLELANALIQSSHTGEPVSLPLDPVAYSTTLAHLRHNAAALVT